MVEDHVDDAWHAATRDRWASVMRCFDRLASTLQAGEIPPPTVA